MDLTNRQKSKILFITYFKAMLFAFTGGAVTLPILQEELDDKHHLMTRDKVLEYFALGQSMPGVISLNAGIFIGREIAGKLGAAAVAAGVILPAFLGMLLIAAAYDFMTDVSMVNGAINGIRAASVAVIALNAYGIIRQSAKTRFGILLTIGAFIAAFVLRIDVLYVILICGVIGVFYGRSRKED